MHVGLISGNAAKNLSKQPAKKAVEEDMQNLRIEEKINRKDLNVLEEFKKSGMKKSASFVVVGKYWLVGEHKLTNRSC
jgi:hypothetical protein